MAANRAIAFKNDSQYVIVQDDAGDKYIIGEELLESSHEIKEMFSSDQVLMRFNSKDGCFDNLKYQHPLKAEAEMGLYPGSHVTMDAGTGLVHTAPAHGQEDYLLGLSNDLDLSCPVNELGR